MTTQDILGPSEQMRSALDYFSHTARVHELIEMLAETSPRVLACMQADGTVFCASWLKS